MPHQYLFVYGTLRSDANSVWHERLIKPYFTLVGTGTVQGALYSLGEYPGLVESMSEDSFVQGEVYSFDADTTSFSELDEYEGCADSTPQPHEYIRKLAAVLLNDGRKIDAWCYFYLGIVAEEKRIEIWSS